MPIIFVAVQHIPRLLRLSSKLPTLKIIVAMEPLEFESKTILTAWGEQVGIKVMDLSEGVSFPYALLARSDSKGPQWRRSAKPIFSRRYTQVLMLLLRYAILP